MPLQAKSISYFLPTLCIVIIWHTGFERKSFCSNRWSVRDRRANKHATRKKHKKKIRSPPPPPPPPPEDKDKPLNE